VSHPTTSVNLSKLADAVGGRLRGADCPIFKLSTLKNAETGSLSFLVPAGTQNRSLLKTTRASALILSPALEQDCPSHISVIISDDPRLAFAKITRFFSQVSLPQAGLHPTVVVGEHAHIAASASVGAYCVIGDHVTLGENVILYPGCTIGNDSVIEANTILQARVTLYEKVRIGKHCLIQSGVVIGSDGFGFAHDKTGWVKMFHMGGVVIGSHVEIGSNTTIDRGLMEDTIIEDGVIIDNLVQIAHNVSIGARTAIAGCTGIAGSTKIGQDCMIGGAANIGGHLEIGNKVYIAATSSVGDSFSEPGLYTSVMPAKPNEVWRKNAARFLYLDKMAKRLRDLEKRLEEHFSN